MHLIETLKALSDESRIRLVNILSRGQFNVQELTSIVGCSQSTISHHLKVLQTSGIVKSQREGTWIYYTLENGAAPSPATRICGLLLEISSGLKDDQALRTQLQRDSQQVSSIIDKRRDRTRSFFDTHAAEWSEMRNSVPGDETLMAEVLALVSDSSTLLELGCGSGALFERALPRSGQTIGVDNSRAMLDEARDRLAKFKDGLDLRLGNLEHLPLGDGSVDQAVAYMVMHHIAHPVDALREACRVLKPGGDLIVADLTRHNDENMRERYADLWLGFEPKTFEKWLTESGFSNIKIRTFGPKQEAFIVMCRS